MMRFIVLAALAALATADSSNDFSVNILSTCEAFSGTTGACIQWRSKGSLEQDTCFPAQAMVTVERENGQTVDMPIAKLKIGDRVLTRGADGQDTFADVLDWLHRVEEGPHMMVNLTTEAGHWVEMTATHLLSVNDSWVSAEKVQVGDILQHPNGASSRVISTTQSLGDGLFNPLLSDQGTLYVNNVLSHTMTHVDRWGFPAAWAQRFMLWRSQHYNQTLPAHGQPDEHAHPLVKDLSRLFGYKNPATSDDLAAVEATLSLFDDADHSIPYTGDGKTDPAFVKMSKTERTRRASSSSSSSNNNNNNRQQRLLLGITTALISHFSSVLFQPGFNITNV